MLIDYGFIYDDVVSLIIHVHVNCVARMTSSGDITERYTNERRKKTMGQLSFLLPVIFRK